MTTKQSFAVILKLGAAVTFVSQPSVAQPERRSPYFIDGIHCEGLETLETGEDITRAYPDDLAEIGRKARLQELCESIFKGSGLKKFQWVTPEDLEKSNFILTHSKRYQAVEVRLEKSELQNHVHIIGKFSMFEAKPYYHLSLAQGFENDKSAGERHTTQAQGAVHFNRRGHINPAPVVLGFKYFSTQANDPLELNLSNSGDNRTTLTPEEQLAQVRPRGQFGSTNVKIQESSGTFVDFSLQSSKLTGDAHPTINARIETGTEFQWDPLSPSLSRISLFYATYSADNDDLYTAKLSSRNSRSIAFAGVYQDFHSRWFQGWGRIYRSLTPELHVFGDADLSVPIGRYFQLFHALGLSGEYLRGAILPEHRFGLPDRNLVQYYYKIEDAFFHLGTDNQLALKLGLTTYQAVNQLDKPYFKDQIFSELSWKSQGPHYETSLALIFGNRRLY